MNNQNIELNNIAFTNEIGRIQCGDIEFSAGDSVEVKINSEWKRTVIEYSHQAQVYYSTDFIQLIGNPIRIYIDTSCRLAG